MAKTRGIRLRNVRDQIAFCAFHSFLVEVQTNAGYIHATHEDDRNSTFQFTSLEVNVHNY